MSRLLGIDHYCSACGRFRSLGAAAMCGNCIGAWAAKHPATLPRTVLDGCGGAGGAARGYVQAGFEVWGVDSNPRLEQDYLASGAARFICADILEILADRQFVHSFDFVHLSAPCFAAGTPVLTRRGSVGVENVRVGDEVWTHANRWRRVSATMSRESPLVRVGPVTTTPGHPFLAARKTTTRTLYSPSEGRLPRGRRPPSRSQVPEWVPATQLQGLFLASPTAVTNAGAAQWACDPWLAGRYTADGWTSSKNGIMIAVGSAKVTDFEHECGQLPWTVSPSGPNCYRYTLCDHEMATELRTWFGHGAAAKTLPAWLLSADEKDRRRFLAGYLSGDGSATANGWHANTVSAHLACQIRLLALGLGFASQVREVRTPATTIIEGRTVSQRNYWTVTINRDATRYGVQQDGKYWFKQRRPVTSAGFATVYDLTVEEDHSFIAWGYVVHNCQHWSRMSRCRPGLSARYPDLITPSRPLLEASGRPWVIENVSAARTALRDPVALCIFMFGRKAYRHRLFETGGGFTFAAPPPVSAGLPPGTRLNRECGWPHPVPAAKAGHWQPGMFVSVSGHERKRPVQEVMETPWMRNREDVKEAIPPYFTRYLGGELLRQIG